MKPNRSKSWPWKVAIVALFVFSYFAVRSRIIHDPLIFEEGIFAELIVNRPPGPMNNMGGQIDGQKLYGYFQHPAPSYELLRAAGWLAQKQLAYPVYLDDEAITPRLRTVCSLFQLTLWLTLAGILCFSKVFPGKWPWVMLFVAALSPLAIRTSVSLQTDNTAGVFFCGLASLLFMLAGKKMIPQKITGIVVFLGAFIAGLGKQEWSFALAMAAIILVPLATLLKLETPAKTTLCTALLIIFSLVLGNLVSYGVDPVNYAKGFEVMSRFSKVTESSASSWAFAHWMGLMKLRIPFISVCLALFLFFLLSATTNKKQSVFAYLLFLYGGFLFAGYVLSDWNYELRYFAPSLAVLTVACITAAPPSLPALQNKAAVFIFSLVGLSTAFFSVGAVPKRNIHLEQIKSGILQPTPDTVLYIDSGAAWNKPEIDYINNNSNNYEAAQIKIKERYGKKLIKAP